MTKKDKRVTRDMRLTMLKIHNDLKDIKNTIEECKDIWLSDLQNPDDLHCIVSSGSPSSFTSSANTQSDQYPCPSLGALNSNSWCNV